MKRAWDPVTLRVHFWHAESPEPGDELRTATGRRYQILSYSGKVLKCVVLPSDAPLEGTVFGWTWGKRIKR